VIGPGGDLRVAPTLAGDTGQPRQQQEAQIVEVGDRLGPDRGFYSRDVRCSTAVFRSFSGRQSRAAKIPFQEWFDDWVVGRQLLALPTLEGWIVRHAREILEFDHDAVHKRDAGKRSLIRGLENHARSGLAIDDVIDTVFDGAKELLDLSRRHAQARRRTVSLI
jgi:hypothetical protein